MFVVFAIIISLFFAQGYGRITSSFCPEAPPESLCDKETQQECPKDPDADGCFHGSYCLPKEIIIKGQKCPLSCPPLCDENDEIFCASSSAPDNSCPTPDICVPKIDKETGCPNFCPTHCNSTTEKVCPGVRKGDGCRGPETCLIKGLPCPKEEYDEEGCTMNEIPECSPGETLCDGGYNSRGCPKRSFCMKLQNKTESGDCPTFCPANCLKGVETECPRTFDEDGCAEAPVCKKFVAECPASSFQPLTGCPVPPIDDDPSCIENPDKQLCPKEPLRKSTLALEFGILFNFKNLSSISENDPLCDTGSFCVDKIDRDTGCRIYCPIFCDEKARQRKCPGVFDEKGCLGPGSCVSIDERCPESLFDIHGCFIHGEVNCDPLNEVKCLGIRDQRGCVGRSTCIPINSECACPQQEFDEIGCPLDVPNPFCSFDEILCPKGKSDKGCSLGKECVKALINGCPNHCIPRCKETEQVCPILKNEPFDDDVNFVNCSNIYHDSYECIPRKDSKDCQLHCSSYCTIFGLKSCPLIYDAEGCPTDSEICMTDLNLCPKSPFDADGCPAIEQITECEEEEDDEKMQICPGGTDSRGCPRPNFCIPSLTPTGHGAHCPAVCSQDQMTCSRGSYNGISMGEICVDSKAYEDFMPKTKCATVCPAACDWSVQKACSGGYNALTGCPHQDRCVAKGVSCHLETKK